MQENDKKQAEIGKISQDLAIISQVDEAKMKLQAGVKRMLTGNIRKEVSVNRLIEEKNINEENLDKILTEDDYNYYYAKKIAYLEENPDTLTTQFDLDNLHLMIMEQVFQRGLLLKKKKFPAVNISKDYDTSFNRQQKLQESLSMRRKDRIKEKGQTKQTINIASLSLSITDKDQLAQMEEQIRVMRKEENEIDPLGDKVTE